MALHLEIEPDRTVHPVDIIEHIASINDWNFERQDADEISISVRGSWSDYHVSFNWMEDLEKKEWVQSVEVINYSRLDDRNSIFHITIHIRE